MPRSSQLAKKITEIVFFGNVWISLGASALTLYTYILLGWEINYLLISLVFFATLASYNFQRVIRLKDKSLSKSGRHFWIISRKNFLIFIILISLLIDAFLFFYLFSIIDLLIISPLILIGFFYAFSPKKNIKPLRDQPYLKIILIAISWIIVTIILPAYLQNEITSSIFKLSVSQFLYIIGLTIPFDIRDLEHDEKEKRTIPQMIGVKNSILLSVFLIVTAGILHLIWFNNYWLVEIIFILSIITISFTNPKKSELFYVFIVDGLLLLFPIFSLVQNLIHI